MTALSGRLDEFVLIAHPAVRALEYPAPVLYHCTEFFKQGGYICTQALQTKSWPKSCHADW